MIWTSEGREARFAEIDAQLARRADLRDRHGLHSADHRPTWRAAMDSALADMRWIETHRAAWREA